LDFALQQVAAESYLDQQAPLQQILIDGNNDRRVPSGTGPNGASRLTPDQARNFVNRYVIIDHQPNDSAGFSATLLFDTKAQQYTLSFRSTEYKLSRDGGDFERDAMGADREIRNYGIAFAQIESMERYFTDLTAGRGATGVQTPELAAFRDYIAANGRINVTGYSLGGHIATMFATLHQTQVRAAYVFNSPGRNEFAAPIADIIAFYRAVLTDPTAATPIAMSAPAQSNTRALFNDAIAQQVPSSAANIYISARYQWAVEATRLQFAFPTFIRSKSGLGGGVDQIVTNIYGRATSGDSELVANFGVHSSDSVRIFIEDQPDVQGLIGHTPLFPEWVNTVLSGKGDFGTTHSLALLIDSLSLMSVLQATNPTLDNETIAAIFGAASDSRANGVLGAGTGTAEGDSLERVLDAMRKLFAGRPVVQTPFDAGEGGFANFQNRTTFHVNIASLRDEIAQHPTATVEEIVSLSGRELRARAVGDIAYRYALKELNPFVVIEDASLYKPYNTVGELAIAASPYVGQWTPFYLEDRAELLAWKNRKNLADVNGPIRQRGVVAVDFSDRASGLQLSVRNAAVSPSSFIPARQVVFGSDFVEVGSLALIGGPRNDALYGGGGADELNGAEGDDYLQGDGGSDNLTGGIGDDRFVGGDGDDLLNGGIGRDTYIVGQGADTIIDEDGHGVVLDTSGRRIAGLFVKQGNQYVFADDPALIATKNSPLTIFLKDGAKVIVNDFSEGEFGIRLADPKQPIKQAVIPTTLISASDLSATRLVAPAAGATLEGKSRSDYLIGGAGNDRLLGGTGADWLTGNLGSNRMEAGAGNDVIVLGEGEDYVDGGADGDFIAYFGGDKYPASLDSLGGLNVVAWNAPTKLDLVTGAREIAFEAWLGGGAVALSSHVKQQDFVTRTTFSRINGQEIRGGGGADIINSGPGDDLIYGDRGVDAAPLAVPAPGEADATDFIIAGAGNDTVFGEGGNDSLMGADGADYIDAGGGNDWALGDAGDDTLIGGAGADVLFGDNFSLPLAQHGADYLDGGEGDDALWGGGGADALFGGDGNDQLAGDDENVTPQYQGADYLDGEGGNDVLVGFGGDDELFGGGGNDQLEANAGDDYLDGEDGDDTLFGDDGADQLFGGDGADDMQGGAGADYLDGEAADDLMHGDAGDDELFGGAGNDAISGGSGADTLDGEDGADLLNGDEGDDTLFGSGGDDRLAGDAGNDVLDGGTGNDVLDASAGDDVLEGGTGTDTLRGGAGNDTYVYRFGDGTDNIVDSDGSNRIRFSDVASPAGLTIRASADGKSLIIEYGGAGDSVILSPGGGLSIQELEFSDGTLLTPGEAFAQLEQQVVTGTSGADNLSSVYPNTRFDAGAGDDRVDASIGNDLLSGGDGADTLFGRDGDDVLDGGPGADTLAGGRGRDTYLVGHGSGRDTVIEDEPAPNEPNTIQVAAGIRPVDASLSRTGAGVTLKLDATGDEVTFPTWYSEVAVSGQVTTPVGVTAVDEIRFADGTVWTSADISARLNVPNPLGGFMSGAGGSDLIHGGAGRDTINGNAGDDALYGDAGGDALSGGWGADALFGGEDNDVLDGGEGADWLDGGAGNDNLAGGNGDDVYVFARGGGTDVISEASGTPWTDTILLTGGIRPEDLILIGGTRVPGRIELTLRGTNDSIAFAAGAALDVPTIEQVVFENGVAWSAADVLSHVVTTPTSPDRDDVYGTPFDDVIDAGGGNDTVAAGDGNDVIDGGTGDDILAGGAGRDTYLFNIGSGNDEVQELGGGPANLSVVKFGPGIAAASLRLSRVTWDASRLVVQLAGSADTLSIPGFFDVTAQRPEFQFAFADGTRWDAAAIGVRTVLQAGRDLPDTINGTIGADVLSGLDDDDRLSGGDGDDHLSGGPGRDRLSGGAGADFLDGGPGDDILAGDAGDDIYAFGVGSGHDGITADAEGGVDVIQFAGEIRPQNVTVTTGDQYRFSLASGDAITIGATAAFRVRFVDGTLWNFNTAAPGVVVSGTAANDSLAGRVGEVLDGGAGDDNIVVGRGGRLMFGHGSGSDTAFFQGSGAIVLKPDVRREQVLLQGIDAGALKLSLSGSPDSIYVPQWFSATDGRFDTLLFADGTSWDIVQIQAHLITAGTAAADYMIGSAAADVLNGNAGSDAIDGGEGDDTVSGGDDADAVDGGSGNDTVSGGAGVDELSGGAGNDVLDGGPDADVIVDGPGDDRYLFSRGFGADSVVAEPKASGTDRVEFDATIRPADVVVSAVLDAFGQPADLVLSASGTSDTLTLEGWLRPESRFIEEVRFSDGTTWNAAALLAQVTITSEASDLIDGTGFADTFDARGGDDLVNGYGGNDVLSGGSGNDELSGGAGDDTLDGGEGADRLSGDTGNDTLRGGAGEDVLNGGTGNDLLDGGLGADSMFGGPGNDTYGIYDSDDVVNEDNGGGIDTVKSVVTYTLGAGLENLTLTGSSAVNGTGNALANRIAGNPAANVLSGGAGNDTLAGGGGADTLRGGAGDDAYWVDVPGAAIVENANEGNDVVRASISFVLPVNVENLTLTGTAAINATGNSAANILIGNTAPNVLDGAAGADALSGGAGNDNYVVDNPGDVVTEKPNEGIDTVRSSIAYVLPDNVEVVVLTGTAALDATGNALDNVLTGNAAANALGGGAGTDTLDGGAGADALAGGAGNDAYVVDNAGDVVSENAGEGVDTVRSTISYTLTANVENLLLIGSASIAGNGNALNNSIIGNAANNALDGAAGNDMLDGGSGIDRLSGGAGDDVYIVDQSGDEVVENANEGMDTVRASVTYVLGANVENLALLGTSAIGGTGNGLGNALTGNAGANVLVGGAGNDRLDGAAGADTLSGGSGDDMYVVDNAGDVLLEAANEGNDSVQSAVSYTLGENVENLALAGSSAISGTGNALANTMTGNSAANTLDGRAGADRLAGGAGDDVYIVDHALDAVVENANAGTDTVRSAVSYVLAANVENLVLTGTSAIDATGNALANALTGNAASNSLVGGAGDDNLSGGAGADRMAGGAGNDIYVVDNPGDVVAEAPAEGADTVNASVTYALAANVENLALSGTAAIDATGNELPNTISGNAAANVLSGGAGNDVLSGGAGTDTLIGGLGDDTFIVEDAVDIVVETVDGGRDTVRTAVSYTLGANVENLSLSGTLAVNGTGNALENTIVGNAAANTISGGAGNDLLDGGAGADLLIGAAGNDVYTVDNAGDAVTENANEGTDTVRSSVSYLLGANVENLSLTGAVAITGTGNTLANTLEGNSAANTLTGGAGNDILDGGAGADRMIGGSGDDVYVVDQAGDSAVENVGEGTDTVRTGGTYVLGANIENGVLLGTGNADLTGNAANNELIGNAANNVLNGGAGSDTLRGGGGDDTYVVDVAGDAVVERAGEGADTVLSAATYTLAANVERLVLTGASAISAVGNDLDNALTGNASANVLDGGRGADNMAGSTGDDTYAVDNRADVVTEAANAGIDVVRSSVAYTLGANVENLTLLGTAAIDGTGNTLDNVIVGNAAVNVLSGGVGNDTLDGGAGGDTLRGGVGNDVYLIDSAADAVVENVNEGIDTVRTRIAYAIAANVENAIIEGVAAVSIAGNALDNVITGNAAANVLAGGAGNDTLDGAGGADTLSGDAGNDIYLVDSAGDVVIERAGEGLDTVKTSVTYALGENVENLALTGAAAISGRGNALANVVTGNAAPNVLFGDAGNDVLDGAAGADVLTGGSGDDTYVVDTAADSVVESANEGIDLVRSSVSLTLAANVEKLALTGTAALSGTGNAAANDLVGNGAANILNGGTGVDRMSGGAGDDTYVVDDAGDTVVENANQGIDLVQSSVSYALAANVENLTLMGAASAGSGNALDNAIRGNALANVLTGAAGNDTLDGDLGADTLIGGVGNDILVVDNAADLVVENPNEGIDTVRSSIAYVLGANVENLILAGAAAINGTGNELSNSLTGNGAVNALNGGAGNDMLDGGAGADTLLGGVGNDIYVVDNAADVVRESANEGSDIVRASVSYALPDNVENLTLTGTAALDGTGNSLDNALLGNAASNRLSGGSGKDALDGAGGADLLTGGVGDDRYTVDNVGDIVVENAGEGIDTVASSISYILAANIENLTLTGSAAATGVGNALDNFIGGNAATNILSGLSGSDMLDGGAGADTMIGGIGHDVYVVDNAGDTIVENANEGVDAIRSVITVTLGANVENLTLMGASAIDGTGNALNNVIAGNPGNNTLDGGAGADTMMGRAGDDTYLIDNAADVVVENAGEGIDMVSSGVSYVLPANVEKLRVFAFNGTGTGDNLDNELLGGFNVQTLVGGAGNDVLDGDAGIDVLIGGAGNDTYYASSLKERIVENAGEGMDTVRAGPSYMLPANVENLIADNSRPIDTEFDEAIAHYVMVFGEAALAGVYHDTPAGPLLDMPLPDSRRLQLLDLWGNAGNNQITGGTRNDFIDGKEGADTLFGGAGDDQLFGGPGDDVLLGSEGQDLLVGGPGNDTLTRVGHERLFGDDGNDTLHGNDGVLGLFGGAGDDTYVVGAASMDYGFSQGGEKPDDGTDTLVSAASQKLTSAIENLALTGTAPVDGTGNELPNAISGNSAANALAGGFGADTLRGGAGTDLLDGGADNDTLLGESDNDVLQGGAGNDVLTETAGNNLLDGGAGNDTLTGNAGHEVFIGGTGSDTITTGAGRDIIAFDRGDGRDVVIASAGADNTLSIGGGIRYSDMRLTKTANDLVLDLGAGDSIAFKDWYAAPANRSVLDMQMIAEAMADFSAASADPLRSRKVATLNFANLVNAFDASGAAAAWALTDTLLEQHLVSGSDSAAIGADIAYRYGKAGSLAGMGFDTVVAMLASGSLGASAQMLQPQAATDSGARRLN
jgi:Ca2+-binding RTX toxin-like protein